MRTSAFWRVSSAKGRIHIKVAYPRSPSHDWEIFHPKVGLFHDSDGNTISFEGSVNETVGGWARNYERFKVHRSWVPEQADYVAGDEETFERLWRMSTLRRSVYDLPEAIEEDIIDWKAPDTESDLQEAIQIANGTAPPTERDKASIIQDGPLSPGGLALAEEASTITPWPHQRVVSDTLVNTYPQSFLLCDEVGLGKTIEAGLTLSRLDLPASWKPGYCWFRRVCSGSGRKSSGRSSTSTPSDSTGIQRAITYSGTSAVATTIHHRQRTSTSPESANGRTAPSGGSSTNSNRLMPMHRRRWMGRLSSLCPGTRLVSTTGGIRSLPLDRVSDRTRNAIPASCRGRDHDLKTGWACGTPSSSTRRTTPGVAVISTHFSNSFAIIRTPTTS